CQLGYSVATGNQGALAYVLKLRSRCVGNDSRAHFPEVSCLIRSRGFFALAVLAGLVLSSCGASAQSSPAASGGAQQKPGGPPPGPPRRRGEGASRGGAAAGPS